MDSHLQMLLPRLDHLSGEFVKLRDGFRMAIRIAEEDPEMALTRVRKLLEYVVCDFYDRRCEQKSGTQLLENLIQRLAKDGHLPKKISVYANNIREMGNVGAHYYGEQVSMEDVRRSLEQLLAVLDWYFKAERPEALARTKPLGTVTDRSLSRRNKLYRRYFERLADELKENGEKASIGRSWCNFSSGTTGIRYNTDFARGDRVRAELYINENQAAFNELHGQREAIEHELGEILDWQPLPKKRASRITLYRRGTIEDSDESLAEIRVWVIDRLLKLKHVFGPRLRQLSKIDRRSSNALSVQSESEEPST